MAEQGRDAVHKRSDYQLPSLLADSHAKVNNSKWGPEPEIVIGAGALVP